MHICQSLLMYLGQFSKIQSKHQPYDNAVEFLQWILYLTDTFNIISNILLKYHCKKIDFKGGGLDHAHIQETDVPTIKKHN